MKMEVGVFMGKARPTVLLFFVLLSVLGADECQNRIVNHTLEDLLAHLSQPGWGAIEPSDLPFLRVHCYPERLKTDEYVEPFSPATGPGAATRITCGSENGCLLFFVDTNHWAHFAHTTVIAVWEIDTGSFQSPIVGEWWPLLNGEPIFDTVRKREDWVDEDDPDLEQTIVFPRNLATAFKLGSATRDPIGISVMSRPTMRTMSVVPTPGPEGADACGIWAVIVNGYDDPEDTFHIDTDGIYRVLRSRGVPKDQIHYLCPHPDETEGCEIEVKLDALEKILEESMGSALADSTCEELVVFYSSHGGSDVLWCGKCDDCPQVSYSQLAGWLDVVNCPVVTVVVEACQSGELIDKIQTGPVGQSRFIFTSTDKNGESFRDIDETVNQKDSNPSDIGSETIWGYVEAFGTGSTDGDGDKKVSFGEATVYAKKYDVTSSVGNLPLVFPDPPNHPTLDVHSCAVGPGSDLLKMELAQPAVVAPAEEGQILRCRCNSISARVTALGTVAGAPSGPGPFATVRFFWTGTTWSGGSEPTWDPDSLGDFKEIRDSIQVLSSDGYPHDFEVTWEVGSNIEAGTVLTLLAVVDSPRSPITAPAGSFSSWVQNNDQVSALKLEVINPSSCFLFPCKGGSRTCD